MPPPVASKTRQFAFVLDAEEHRMRVDRAERSELSASEWLGQAIRERYQAGGLESLPQRIKRTWDALELEHDDSLRRCKLANERHAPRPTASALERRIGELAELIESSSERRSEMRSCLKTYRSAIARALPGIGSVDRIQRELQEKFDELWACVDEWLDRARASA